MSQYFEQSKYKLTDMINKVAQIKQRSQFNLPFC